MKKIILSMVCILVASSLFAQEEDQSQHEMTVNLGGGLSTLKYKMESGTNPIGLKESLGGSLGLGYMFFLNNQLGIGTGVEANFYQSRYSNDALTGSYRDAVNPDHPNPEYFQLKYTYSEAYKEKQNALFLQIPLMFQFQTGGLHKFYVAAGGRVGFPVYTKYNTDASKIASITGHYDYEGGNPYENLPLHGFTNYDAPKVDGKLSFKIAYMASLELGMKWALGDNFILYTGLYGDYGLNDIQKTKNKGTVTYQHEDQTSQGQHDFLKFDNSVTSTSTIEKITPMTFGVKLRVSFGLGETKVGAAKSKNKGNRSSEDAIREQQRLYYEALAEQALKRAEAARLQENEEEIEDYAPAPGNGRSAERQPVTNQDMKILMEPIWGFDITKTVLTSDMKRVLDRKIPILKKYWYLGIVCEGHTCDIGSDQINEKFGYERAQAVKEYFVKKGLVSTRFSTISKGKHFPAVSNISEEHRKRNRRVELSIKK